MIKAIIGGFMGGLIGYSLNENGLIGGIYAIIICLLFIIIFSFVEAIFNI